MNCWQSEASTIGSQSRYPSSPDNIEKLVITVSSSAKRVLSRGKPAWIAPKMAEKMIKTVYDMKPRDRKFYPPLTRFRQARGVDQKPIHITFSAFSDRSLPRRPFVR